MLFTFDKYDVPRFYHKKETFGDIDIIVSMESFNQNMNEYIKKTFNPNEIFHNGNAWSFDYKEIQVDFITCAPEDFDSNYHYMAFNDLGNFIGRLAQSIGLKYGQEGLWYNHYSDNKATKTKIIISKDYPKIFKFLDLNYNRWITGFDTLEDIFEYVITSKYFNAPMFQLSELNKINRERNVKRKSYMSFLEYIENKDSHPEYDKGRVKLIKNNIINVIRNEFPEANIDLHLRQIEYDTARKNLIGIKFNGQIIKDKYNLNGKDLGESIINFKLYVDKVHEISFNEFIVASSIDYIYGTFEQANNIVK
jgi:hypothetical protein